MVNFLCIGMGLLDIATGIIIVITMSGFFLYLGIIMIGKGVISLF